MPVLFLLGRILFAAIFIISAPGDFTSAGVGYARAAGVPRPEILVPLAGVLSLVGALMLLFGIKPRVGAWLLFIFLVPVTLIMHRFWGVANPQMAQMQMVNFMKNLSMMGGTLMFQMIDRWPLAITHDTRQWVNAGVAPPPREAHGHV